LPPPLSAAPAGQCSLRLAAASARYVGLLLGQLWPELAPGHRVSRPPGTGSVGDSVGEGSRCPCACTGSKGAVRTPAAMLSGIHLIELEAC